MNNKVYAVDFQTFNNMMKERGITDENVNEWKSTAFIEIQARADIEDMPECDFYFKKDSDNVIRMEFDDTTKDFDHEEDGKIRKVRIITDEDAKRLAEFINNNIEKSFLVHCHAGVSRSGAVIKYIWEKKDLPLQELLDNNPYIHPNFEILSKLRKNEK